MCKISLLKRLSVLLTSFLFVGFLLSGCGGSSNSDDSKKSNTEQIENGGDANQTVKPDDNTSNDNNGGTTNDGNTSDNDGGNGNTGGGNIGDDNNNSGNTGDDNNQTDDSNTKTVKIKGMVSDISGNDIKGAVITINGKPSGQTDNKGEFIKSVKSSKSKKISIGITKKGYIYSNKVVDTNSSPNEIELNFVLIKNDHSEAIPSDKDKEIIVPNKNGAKLFLRANGYVDRNGNPYDGNVSVDISFNHVTNYEGRNAFPGEFAGVREDNTTTMIESYGFFNINLWDKDGNKLNLKEGSNAKLTFPLDEKLGVTPNQGDVIPLWYFDKKKGQWIEDGFATYDAATKTYSGEVKHFTPWNLDKPIYWGWVKGRVVDTNGEPVVGARIDLSSGGWYGGKYIYTNLDGTYYAWVRSNRPIIIWASVSNPPSGNQPPHTSANLAPITFTVPPRTTKELDDIVIDISDRIKSVDIAFKFNTTIPNARIVHVENKTDYNGSTVSCQFSYNYYDSNLTQSETNCTIHNIKRYNPASLELDVHVTVDQNTTHYGRTNTKRHIIKIYRSVYAYGVNHVDLGEKVIYLASQLNNEYHLATIRGNIVLPDGDMYKDGRLWINGTNFDRSIKPTYFSNTYTYLEKFDPETGKFFVRNLLIPNTYYPERAFEFFLMTRGTSFGNPPSDAEEFGCLFAKKMVLGIDRDPIGGSFAQDTYEYSDLNFTASDFKNCGYIAH